MARKVKRKITQSAANALQELEQWIGVDKERSEKVLIVAQLLACGYEVTPSPEEIILENYKKAKKIVETEEDDRNAPLINEGYLQGIKETLDTLGIKIKGINE